MKGKKKQHFWTYVGVEKEHHNELGHCPLCNKYRIYTKQGYTIISKKKYDEIVIPGSWNW